MKLTVGQTYKIRFARDVVKAKIKRIYKRQLADLSEDDYYMVKYSMGWLFALTQEETAEVFIGRIKDAIKVEEDRKNVSDVLSIEVQE